MKLKDVMTPGVREISPDASLRDAARQMKELNVGALPVCDGERIVGMLTDRDIAIRAVAEGCDPDATRASEVMSPGVVWCSEDDDVREAARLMEKRQIRRLLVMDRNKKAIGIVSLGDLATRHHDDKLSGQVLEGVSEPSKPSSSPPAQWHS
jgi:CBS domain-containing protein